MAPDSQQLLMLVDYPTGTILGFSYSVETFKSEKFKYNEDSMSYGPANHPDIPHDLNNCVTEKDGKAVVMIGGKIKGTFDLDKFYPNGIWNNGYHNYGPVDMPPE